MISTVAGQNSGVGATSTRPNRNTLAEQTGLIGPLTAHILDAALAQARRWLDAGRPLVVSVNHSARNLLDEGLPQQVSDLLGTHDVPAGYYFSRPIAADAFDARYADRRRAVAACGTTPGQTAQGAVQCRPRGRRWSRQQAAATRETRPGD